jgi:hypothetical protein
MKRHKAEPPAKSAPVAISGFFGTAFLLVLIVFYLVGLTIWSPFYVIWPRRYPDTTWPQSVVIRGSLVWHLWSRYVFRREPREGRS